MAQALEALSLLTEPPLKKAPPRHQHLSSDICYARSCYDHLAGTLGVKLINALLNKRYLLWHKEHYTLTAAGERFFATLGINCAQLQAQPRQFTRCCIDWTEREYHLAGSLGQALLDYFLAQRLLLRSRQQARVLRLTHSGKLWFKAQLGLIV